MSDLADQAQEVEQRHREDALRAVYDGARAAPVDWRQASAKWCEGPSCGERIPDSRREAVPGVRLCVDCQELRERGKRTRGW